MAKIADKYFREDAFAVIEEGFNPAYGQTAESIFSLGNEYMGVRGYFEEGYSGASLKGSYFNGVFEENIQPPGGYKGISPVTEYMVNSVDYLACEIKLDEETLDLNTSQFRGFYRKLDFSTGLLTRSFVWKTKGEKEVELTFERFLCMEKASIAAQKIKLKALNFCGEIKVSMLLDFSVNHKSMNENLWDCIDKESDLKYLEITASTQNTKQVVSSAAKIFGDAIEPLYYVHEEKKVGAAYPIFLEADKEVCIGRIIGNEICISNDDVEKTAFEDRKRARKEELALSSYEELLEENRQWWKRVWETSDIVIDGDESNQQGIRFCIFQMFQTYHGTRPGTNIGAKGLTGEAYNGNAFWDTETYCLPFYVFNDINAAKNLLMFRYLTLQEAMERAKALDCKGAFYPIATISGRECCNLWQHASLQLQASTAVAYGIWFYEKQTGDTSFTDSYGAKILVEISRMLVTRGDYTADKKSFGYFGVMGPDEFQMMVNHNYYTNYMGKFTLEYGVKVLERIEKDNKAIFDKLVEETHITKAEVEEFKAVAQAMYLPYDEETKLFEQHEGFFKLPHLNIHDIPVEDFPLYHHWTYDRIYRNDMIKQPDVLMLMFLFNSSYSEEQIRNNYEYYEPRCIHESSLSPSVHSVLAAQLKKHEEAYAFFEFATRMDLDNYNRNTNEGLHTTSIAAAWVNIVYGFGGMRSDGEILSFAPSIPKKWNSYSFHITYGGDVIAVTVNPKEVSFFTKDGTELDILVYQEKVKINGKPSIIPIPNFETLEK